jgi:nitrate/nitrite transport system substrate-binding protein
MKTTYKITLAALAALILVAGMSMRKAALPQVKLGFIPLTDCAPLVAAKELGLFQKYGVDVVLSKEASWANIRDKILNGELDGAHCLFGMPFSVYTGLGGKAGSEMQIAMVLNNNGQGITLSKDFCGLVGFKDIKKVAAAVKQVQARKEARYMASQLDGRCWYQSKIGRYYYDSSSADGCQYAR